MKKQYTTKISSEAKAEIMRRGHECAKVWKAVNPEWQYRDCLKMGLSDAWAEYYQDKANKLACTIKPVKANDGSVDVPATAALYLDRAMDIYIMSPDGIGQLCRKAATNIVAYATINARTQSANTKYAEDVSINVPADISQETICRILEKLSNPERLREENVEKSLYNTCVAIAESVINKYAHQAKISRTRHVSENQGEGDNAYSLYDVIDDTARMGNTGYQIDMDILVQDIKAVAANDSRDEMIIDLLAASAPKSKHDGKRSLPMDKIGEAIGVSAVAVYKRINRIRKAVKDSGILA